MSRLTLGLFLLLCSCRPGTGSAAASAQSSTPTEPKTSQSASGAAPQATGTAQPQSSAQVQPVNSVPNAAKGSATPQPLLTSQRPEDTPPGASAPIAASALTTPNPLGAPNASDPSPTQTKTRVQVAIVGDSLSDYRSHGGGFIHYLEKQCPDSEFDNYGKGGEMVNQMRRRFKRDVLGRKKPTYSHVIIFGGVNDLYSDITATRKNHKIESDLSKMYQWAKDAGIQVVAITVSPWGGFTRYFNERRGENTRLVNAWIAQQKGTLVDYVVDAYSLLSCGNPEELCPKYTAPFKDGLHFGKEGHKLLGQALAKQVFQNCK